MPDDKSSRPASPLLLPPEQARVARMVEREIERTLVPELTSIYARDVASKLMMMLRNVALAADDAGALAQLHTGSRAADERQRALAIDAALSKASAADEKRLAELEVPLNAERVSAYLQSLPEFASDAATSVVQLPGGFSKQTFMVDTRSGRKLVIRRDLPRGPTPVSAADELPYLRGLAANGLLVPRPIAADSSTRSLGYPFILVERVSGETATAVAERSPELAQGVALGLARVLAQLHSIAPAALGMQSPTDPVVCIREYVQSWQTLWEQRARNHAPIVKAALSWLHAHIPRTIERLALIHGDARPDNMLATASGEITALLDWEFIHIGDPAEDVLYACQFITLFMDIDAFVRAYRDAGGIEVDDSRAQFYEIWRNVRNLICLDLSWSAFSSGDYPAYVAGTPTLLFRRALIADLGRCLDAVGL